MMNQNRFFFISKRRSARGYPAPQDERKLRAGGAAYRCAAGKRALGAFGQLLASRAGDHAALARGISLYKEQALALVQKGNPGFYGAGVGCADGGRAHRLDFSRRPRKVFVQLFATLKKTEAGIALRAGVNSQNTGEEQPLDRALRLIQTNGSFGCRLRLRASVRIADEVFQPGKKCGYGCRFRRLAGSRATLKSSPARRRLHFGPGGCAAAHGLF